MKTIDKHRARRLAGLNLALGLLLGLGQGALAHEGEDHGAPPPVAAPNAAQRLPDGAVFLPKPAQRRLGLRTVVAETAAQPRSVELFGQVVADPASAARVQASQAGRLLAGPQGLPLPGQRVRQGELLAWLEPLQASAERAALQADRAETQARLQAAERQLQRLRQLEGTVARREIEASEAELAALRERSQALGGAGRREALRAPSSGVIAASHGLQGQVLEARELLFEIVDPARLLIEARAPDAALAGQIAAARLADDGRALQLVGAAAVLREGMVPLLFRSPAAKPGATQPALAQGQPVKLVLQLRETLQGTALPAAAVVRNAANEPIVWIHERAERFRAQPVRLLPLDGRRVLVQGLEGQPRVVVEGAALINQIR